jgi:aspartate-semialdehyde dehydrogenase
MNPYMSHLYAKIREKHSFSCRYTLYSFVPRLATNVAPISRERKRGLNGKILGELSDIGEGKLDFDMQVRTPFRVSASCTRTRVSIMEGHTEIVSVRFVKRTTGQVSEVLAAFISVVQSAGCPSHVSGVMQ